MNIPKNEKTVLTYVFDGVISYTITRNTIGKYVLYKIINGDYQKLKISDSPLDFDKIVEKDRSK